MEVRIRNGDDGRERESETPTGANSTFEKRQLRTTVLCRVPCLSLCACACRAVRERDVQSPDVRSRERACTCLHRVWCRSSRTCLLLGLVRVFFF